MESVIRECPRCRTKLVKAGKLKSGNDFVFVYYCPKCGRLLRRMIY